MQKSARMRIPLDLNKWRRTEDSLRRTTVAVSWKVRWSSAENDLILAVRVGMFLGLWPDWHGVTAAMSAETFDVLRDWYRGQNGLEGLPSDVQAGQLSRSAVLRWYRLAKGHQLPKSLRMVPAFIVDDTLPDGKVVIRHPKQTEAFRQVTLRVF
jgi:hypothetical protein